MAKGGSEQAGKGCQEYILQNKWWAVGLLLLALVIFVYLAHYYGTHKCFNGGIGCLNFIVIVIGLFYAGQQLHSLKKIHTDNHEWNRRIATQNVISAYEKLHDKRTALNEELIRLGKAYPIEVKELLKIFKDKPIMQENCHVVLNYYEELAIGIFWGVYEEEIVKAAMKTKILKTYSIFSNYITSDRIDCQQPTLYEYFEKLVRKWKPDNTIPDAKKIATGQKNT